MEYSLFETIAMFFLGVALIVIYIVMMKLSEIDNQLKQLKILAICMVAIAICNSGMFFIHGDWYMIIGFIALFYVPHSIVKSYKKSLNENLLSDNSFNKNKLNKNKED